MSEIWKCPLCHHALDTREAFMKHAETTHPSDLWLTAAVKPEYVRD